MGASYLRDAARGGGHEQARNGARRRRHGHDNYNDVVSHGAGLGARACNGLDAGDEEEQRKGAGGWSGLPE